MFYMMIDSLISPNFFLFLNHFKIKKQNKIPTIKDIVGYLIFTFELNEYTYHPGV